jgi:hypothetical protein
MYRRLSEERKKDNSVGLPPHCLRDHSIPMKPDFEPPFPPIYSLSRFKPEVLKAWLEKNLKKVSIRASSSPTGVLMLFTKKPNGNLQLCVGYRGLNEGTIKNHYPLPLIQEMLMRLSRAKWFTKVDMRDAYNLIRIADGDEWKTAFRTWYELYESLVMPFGLTNAPSMFQSYINKALRPFLDEFTIAFEDNVLVYSDSLAEHRVHVRPVKVTGI